MRLATSRRRGGGSVPEGAGACTPAAPSSPGTAWVDMVAFSAGASLGGLECVLGRAAALPLDRLVNAIERERQEAKSFVIHGVIGAALERPVQDAIRLLLDGIQPIGIGAARLRQHFQNA